MRKGEGKKIWKPITDFPNDVANSQQHVEEKIDALFKGMDIIV